MRAGRSDYWVDLLASDSDRAREQLVDRLISRGILFRGAYDRLWVMGARKYVQEDGQPLRDVPAEDRRNSAER